MRVLLVLAVLLVAGCSAPEAAPPVEPVMVEPLPPGGEHAACAPPGALLLAVNSRAEAVGDETGLGVGFHRVARDEVVWVWASHDDSFREDRVSRVNEVQVFRDGADRLHACTRVEVVTPMDVDGERRTYDVGARFTFEGLPDAPLRFTVNWVASCAECPGIARGNETAEV